MTAKFRLNMREPHLVSLIILSAFASMGAVLITPALPEMVTYFQISEGHAQLIVTLFLVGYAAGQLIYGPLANRYGRKPAFYTGIVIATIGSIISILSAPVHSFPLMLVGRLLEALGSSAGLVTSFTIISDFYYPEQSRKIISYMMMAFAIVPGVALFFGGLIAQYLHWETCFYFLLVYGLVLFYPAYTLPETLQNKDLYAVKIKRIKRSYFEVFSNKVLITYSLLFGMSCMLPYVFSADGPFIGIHKIGLSAGSYGMIALIPTFGMLVGSILSAQLTQRFSANRLIAAGAFLELFAAIVMLCLFSLGVVSSYSLFVPMFFIFIGHAFVSGNGSSSAMYFAVDKANGSAVMSFICVGMPVVGTLILALLNVQTPMVMPIIFICAIVCLLFLLFTVRKHYIGEHGE